MFPSVRWPGCVDRDCRAWRNRAEWEWRREGSMGSEQHILRAVLGDQCAAIAGQQDGNGVCLEQRASGKLGADAQDAVAVHAGGGEIDVFEDVVEGDVGVESGGTRQGGGRESGEGGERLVGCGETGEDQVVPDHVGLELADGVQQAHRRREAPNFQQRMTLKPGSSDCSAHLKRVAVLIGCEIVLGEFVGENDQFDIRVALQFARDVKGIFIQLAPAGGKGGH